MHDVVERLMSIRSKIKELLIKNNSQNRDLNIIIVCKTFSMNKILPLIDAGHVHFGENKVQEAELKWKEVKKKYSNIKLHMVGKLQTNKVKTALRKQVQQKKFLDRKLSSPNPKLLYWLAVPCP